MAEYKNHGTDWTNEQEFILIDAVIAQVEMGGTQRQAFKNASAHISRSPGACEYHWKKIRKENTDIMEKYQNAVADGLIHAISDPQNPQDDPQEIKDEVIREITKGATKIHRMIEQIINPGQGITLPEEVAHEVADIMERYPKIKCYDFHYLRENEYDNIIEYIEGSPEDMRNYFQAIENGYDVEMNPDQKIRIIYDTLSTIKPNEPGYMMARGMIIMMYHTIEILGMNAERMIGLTRSMPF
jgi:hypothetical protein